MPITAAKLLVKVDGDISGAEAGLSSIEGKVNKFGGSLQSAGVKMTAAFTAPLLLAGKSAVDVGIEFDRSMGVLQAATGATAEEMDRLKDLANELGADLTLPGTSAADAAQAMNELAKAGLDVNETMAASRGVLQLSAAGQLSNADAAKITANALNAFNLEGKEASRVADLLAAAANTSSAEVSDMADAMKMSAAVAASAGIPIEDLTTAIAEMANAGIQGSDAGTSLKQMILSLQAPSDKAAKTMRELGISIYDSRGNMLSMDTIIGNFSNALGGLTQQQRNAALATIFGSDAVRAANVVLMGGVDAYRDLREEVTQTGAASKLAAGQMQGLAGAAENIKSSWETALLAAIDAVDEELIDLAHSVAEAMNAFSDLSPDVQEAIIKFLALAAAAGPATTALGSVVKIGSGLVGIPGKIGAVSAALKEGVGLAAALGAGFGTTAVAAGALTLAAGSLVAVWMQWNKQVVKTNEEGAKAVDDTWSKFFDEQAAAGKNAAQIADEYLAAQQRAEDALNDVNPLLRLFIFNQNELTQSYDGMSNAAFQAAGSYEEYRASLKKVADANDLVINSSGDLVRIVVDDMGNISEEVVQKSYLMTEAAYDAANGLSDLGTGYRGVGASANIAAQGSKEVADALTEEAQAAAEAARATMESKDILDMLSKSLDEAGYSAAAQSDLMDNMKVVLGETSEAQVQLANDVQLVTDAYALGTITQEEYDQAVRQAKEGTLQLTDEQRKNYQASVDQARGLKEAAQAARDFQLNQMNLAQSFSTLVARQDEEYNRAVEDSNRRIMENEQKIAELRRKMAEASSPEQMRQYRQEIKELGKDSQEAAAGMDQLVAKMQKAMEVEVAQAAIGELGKSLENDKISFETYVTAVQEVQSTFGLVNDRGQALAVGLTTLTRALEEGLLPATEYDDALKAMIQDAQDGNVDVQALLSTFATAPGTINPTTGALEGATGALDAFGTEAEEAVGKAQNAAEGIQNAFTTPDWNDLGSDIASGIAQGITQNTDMIRDAAAQAAQEAFDAASNQLQAHSPSDKFADLGRYSMEGYAIGVRDNARQPILETVSAIRQVEAQATQTVSSPARSGAADVSGPASRTNSRAQPITLVVNISGEELKRVILNAVSQELET